MTNPDLAEQARQHALNMVREADLASAGAIALCASGTPGVEDAAIPRA